MTNNIQYEFNKALYSQGTKGIEVGTSTFQGKYANQVIPNPFTIPNGDSIIGIHTFFMGEHTYYLGKHSMAFPREIIIQAYKHHMKEKLVAKRRETKWQIHNALFEMVLGNPKEANSHEFTNAMLNYFALDNSIMRKVLANKNQSLGFVFNISQNPTDICFTSEIDYELWERHSVNNHDSIIVSSNNEQQEFGNINSAETEIIDSTAPVNNHKTLVDPF
jgi:hypothetical protein